MRRHYALLTLTFALTLSTAVAATWSGIRRGTVSPLAAADRDAIRGGQNYTYCYLVGNSGQCPNNNHQTCALIPCVLTGEGMGRGYYCTNNQPQPTDTGNNAPQCKNVAYGNGVGQISNIPGSVICTTTQTCDTTNPCPGGNLVCQVANSAPTSGMSSCVPDGTDCPTIVRHQPRQSGPEVLIAWALGGTDPFE